MGYGQGARSRAGDRVTVRRLARQRNQRPTRKTKPPTRIKLRRIPTSHAEPVTRQARRI